MQAKAETKIDSEGEEVKASNKFIVPDLPKPWNEVDFSAISSDDRVINIAQGEIKEIHLLKNETFFPRLAKALHKLGAYRM